MNDELSLNDIANDLLIVNKMTIDTLFRLENCSDCIALYIFYYKTAKWQKTNIIKANDTYIKKSLKWGTERIRKTKKTLKENGLIDIVQRRKDGKIEGWYIQISYLVTQRKIEDTEIKVVESNNTQNQQVEKSTSGNEETNALKEKIKCLEKEIKMLKNNNLRKKESKTKKVEKKENVSFDDIIENYTSNTELQTELKNHLATRKSKKAALTNRAIELSLKKLDELTKLVPINDRDETKLQIVQQSIERGWTGFFNIDTYKNNNSYKNKISKDDDGWNFLDEEFQKSLEKNSYF